MQVPFFDLRRQHEKIRSELGQAMMGILDSQQFILSSAVEQLERQVARTLGTKRAIGVASGSDALLLSLIAANIGPGDEVIVPAYTFFATAAAAARLGARVVFADVEKQTLEIDPEDVRRKITAKARAVIAVHLFGDCAEMETLLKIAADHGLILIEDAAQAFGARHRNRSAGSMGFTGCLSFYPTKNLAAIGDAGMIVTNDEGTAQRLEGLRAHGMHTRYHHDEVGINSRLDSLQAAVLSVKLKYVEEWNWLRRKWAARYTAALKDVAMVPSPNDYNVPVFHQYVIRTPERDKLRQYLERRGIGAEIYYPVPLHLQEAFSSLGGKPGEFPVAEEAARTSLALPVFPELTEKEVDYVISTIQEFFS